MWKNNIFSVSRCAVTNGIMDDGKFGDVCDKKIFCASNKSAVFLFLFQFLTCVLNRAKVSQLFFFFFRASPPHPPTNPFFFLRVFCQCSARPAGLQRAFTVKPNCARGNCPLPQPGRRSHKSRHPSFVTPPSRSSWLRPSAISEPFFFFCWAQTYPSNPPSGPASRLGDRWVRCSLPLGPRAAPAVWEGGKRNLILAGFSPGPRL